MSNAISRSLDKAGRQITPDKPALKSQTVWGLVSVLLGAAVIAAKIGGGEASTSDLIQYVTANSDQIALALTGIGAILTGLGRRKAGQKIVETQNGGDK